ncbi:TPA: DUF2135 domain-containing protein [Enterobacter chengduensis]|nr:DUF2135 domain-containing protein [Enterobacter chengduensis]
MNPVSIRGCSPATRLRRCTVPEKRSLRMKGVCRAIRVWSFKKVTSFGDRELTTAQISLVTNEGTPDEKQETFVVPLRTPG